MVFNHFLTVIRRKSRSGLIKNVSIISPSLFFYLRFERQQAILKDELAKIAQREREAAKEELAKAMSRERQHKRQEAEKTKQLVHVHVHVHAHARSHMHHTCPDIFPFFSRESCCFECHTCDSLRERLRGDEGGCHPP